MAAEDPYLAPNNSWISLSGTVVSAGTRTFELDYGDGLVLVEMDDWDWYGEAYPTMEGDQVTVYGMVDDDFYETASIEASSVYVKKLNTHFFANDADEEDVPLTTVYLADGTDMLLRGEVTEVDGREFTVDSGVRSMQVDTDEMAYNPMDDRGFQQIDVGDYVEVTGDLDIDVFEQTQLKADSIITLVKDKTKNNRS